MFVMSCVYASHNLLKQTMEHYLMLKKLLLNKYLWSGGTGLLVILVLTIQLVPVEKSNPPVTNEPQWDSPETLALVERACFDCHSNETQWPWYADVGPTRILVRNHVNEGRDTLNFSEFNGDIELDELIEVVQDGEMPTWDYVLLHPNADLSEDEQAQLIAGFKATFGRTSAQNRD